MAGRPDLHRRRRIHRCELEDEQILVFYARATAYRDRCLPRPAWQGNWRGITHMSSVTERRLISRIGCAGSRCL